MTTRRAWPPGVTDLVGEISTKLDWIRKDLVSCQAEIKRKNKAAILDIYLPTIQQDAVDILALTKAIHNIGQKWQAEHRQRGGRPPAWVVAIDE